MLLAAVEDLIVERKAELVRLLVVAIRADARPGDGHAEYVEVACVRNIDPGH